MKLNNWAKKKGKRRTKIQSKIVLYSDILN